LRIQSVPREREDFRSGSEGSVGPSKKGKEKNKWWEKMVVIKELYRRRRTKSEIFGRRVRRKLR